MLSVYQADARYSSLKSDVVFWQRASRRVVVQGSSSCLRAAQWISEIYLMDML
jgi:hypothetical protein